MECTTARRTSATGRWKKREACWRSRPKEKAANSIKARKSPATKKRRNGDSEKVVIAVRVREETVMSVAWIAARLFMGSRNYANHLLWQVRQSTLVNNRN